MFYPNNGVYVMGNISFNQTTGCVTYMTNSASPANTQIWMSNTPAVLLTNMYFSTSFNLDGSQNSSLVNVSFEMNDHGFSQQGTVNNPTSIERSFAVQMRNDN